MLQAVKQNTPPSVVAKQTKTFRPTTATTFAPQASSFVSIKPLSHMQDSTKELTCHRCQAHRMHNQASLISCKALKQHPLRKEASRDKD
jgi:hypothetical protein